MVVMVVPAIRVKSKAMTESEKEWRYERNDGLGGMGWFLDRKSVV